VSKWNGGGSSGSSCPNFVYINAFRSTFVFANIFILNDMFSVRHVSSPRSMTSSTRSSNSEELHSLLIFTTDTGETARHSLHQFTPAVLQEAEKNMTRCFLRPLERELKNPTDLFVCQSCRILLARVWSTVPSLSHLRNSANAHKIRCCKPAKTLLCSYSLVTVRDE